MNGIIKSTIKLNSVRGVTNTVINHLNGGAVRRPFTRTLWHMCSKKDEPTTFLKITNPSNMCSCGCGTLKQAHTKTEQELVEFLKDEINAERKIQKTKTIPTEVDGFKVNLEGAEVTLKKTIGDETIEINFNVNHSVDADPEMEPDLSQNADKVDVALKSKPSFEVDIKRGNTTLGFTCSFLTGSQESTEDGYNDIFGIDELTLYEGEWKDSNYAVSGEVLDGYLYDLLMNLLVEKGVTSELIDKVSDFSTAYEHSSYIALLEGVQKFAAKK